MKTLLSQASQNSEQTSQMEEIDLNDSQTIQSNHETTTESFPTKTIILISSIVLNLILLILLVTVIVIMHMDDKCKGKIIFTFLHCDTFTYSF